MANRYVYSGAAGAGTGADWANAHVTLTAAITASTAGDVFYVANDHAESTAGAVTLTFKGTATTPDRCLCVARAGSVPPVAADLTTGGAVTVTGNFAMTLAGSVYGYGIAFNCGTGNSSAAILTIANTSEASQTWEATAFNIVSTSSNANIILATGTFARIILKSCTVSFGATGQGFTFGGLVRMYAKPGSTFVTGASIPTNFLKSSGSGLGTAQFSGLDLSALGSGKTLLADLLCRTVEFVNCKLDASVTVAATPSTPARGGCDLIGCHSTTNAARNERYRYQGTLTTETTIVRTGGASDGTTAYSWKVVTNANNERDFPFECFEGMVWNATTGSAKTLTIHTVTDNVTLTDAEAWLEVEYLGSSATPVSSLLTDAPATVLTTAANQATSTETWTTTGLTTPVKQKLEVTFTPQMAGPVRWKVKVAKASATVYVDPKPELS